MTSPTKLNFYADFQGLAALKRDAKADAPDALKEAAKQFESLFTRMLLKNMRATSMGNELFDSEETQFYQDMFDDQMAVHLSQGRGLGLADMLVRQLQQAQPQAAAGGRGAFEPQVPGPRSQAPAKRDFIAALLPHAQRAASTLGVDPHALIAQAALETGWGKSLPTHADGSSSFNLFGIKTGSSWRGASVASRTLEFESGGPVAKQERFRAYASAEQSFGDYTTLIARSPRYEAARNTGTDVVAFARALQDGGYATDPQYARKLSALTEEVRALAGNSTDANALKSASAAPLTNSEGVRG